MDVGINEARQHDLVADIHLNVAAVLAHTHNEPLRHGNIPVAQLVGKDVDIGGVFQHQVRQCAACRHINDVELLVELAVDFSCVTLFPCHDRSSLQLIFVIPHIITTYVRCPYFFCEG